MTVFYETENFIVEAHPRPFVSREEGGHIRVRIRDEEIADQTMLSPPQAIELVRLTMIVGQALLYGMNKRGVPVVRINYQEMGNWAAKNNTRPFLHVHIFGRSKEAVAQPYTEAVYLPDRSTGFYDNFVPLNEDDIVLIKNKMEELFGTEKFKNEYWRL